MTLVPPTCTLPAEQQPRRLADIDGLLASTLRECVRLTPTWLRLRLAGGEEVGGQARDLLARESECCTFFRFDLRRSAAGWDLDVRVPAANTDVLDSLEQRSLKRGSAECVDPTS